MDLREFSGGSNRLRAPGAADGCVDCQILSRICSTNMHNVQQSLNLEWKPLKMTCNRNIQGPELMIRCYIKAFLFEFVDFQVTQLEFTFDK